MGSGFVAIVAVAGCSSSAGNESTSAADGGANVAIAGDGGASAATGAAPSSVTCAAGSAICTPGAASCTSLDTTENCGACGVTCNDAQVCDQGACTSGCGADLTTVCDGVCSDVQTDANNCGACGTICTVPAGDQKDVPACVAGSCTIACATNYHSCSGVCVRHDDVATCGTNCAPCVPPDHSVSICTNDACGFSCDSGFHTCGAACADSTAVATCGDSCTTCPTKPNSSPTCDGTKCGFACDAGYAHCSGVATDVCETNTADDPQNCGACGHDCGGGACAAGICQPYTSIGDPAAAISSGDTGFFAAGAHGAIFWKDAGGGIGYGEDYVDISGDGDKRAFYRSTSGQLFGTEDDFTTMYSFTLPPASVVTSSAFTLYEWAWTDQLGRLILAGNSHVGSIAYTPPIAVLGTCVTRGVQFEELVLLEDGFFYAYDTYANTAAIFTPLAGGSAALASDFTKYDYAGGSDGSVYQYSNASTRALLTTMSSPIASLAVDGGSLYILSDSSFDRIDLTTKALTHLTSTGAAGKRCRALAITPTLYVFTSNGVVKQMNR